MNDFLPISNDDLLLYINIFALAFVGLFALIGFIRGFRKSLFYFIATLVIFGFGYISLTAAKDVFKTYELIRNFNLGSFNLEVNGIKINTLDQFILDYIVSLYPGAEELMTTDTMARTLVFGLVEMVLRLVFWLVLILLSFTVFKFIVDIIWFVFKPKKKKGEKRKKKSLGSRFGGAGLGTLKGAFYLLLLLFPIGGVASLAGSLRDVVGDNAQDMRYNLVFVNDEATLVASNDNNKFNQILDLLGLYNKSVPGKVFGSIKADSMLFDYTFSFNVDNTNVKLRKELEIVAKAFSKSDSLKNNGFSVDALLNEDPEVLKEIIEELSELKLIKVAIPMGIEAALLLKDENGNNIVNLPEGLGFDIKDIKDIDYASDIKKLGFAFVDVTTLLPEEGEEIDYLNLNPETVKSILGNVGGTEIVSKLAPIGISYVATIKTVNEALEQVGFTIEDLKLNEVEDWGQELAQFGNIYEAVAALQIKKLDNTETFEYVTEEKVEALSNAIFESIILSNAIPVLVNYAGTAVIPEDYRDQIVIDNDIWDANEFSALVNAAVTVVKSGILDNGEEALQALSNETIDDLSKYLSKSRFFKKNLNVILERVLSDVDFFDTSEIVFLSENEWTKDELSSVFKSVKLILSEGVDNIISLTDDKIDELTTYLSGSKLITRNINGIVHKALSTVDLGDDIEFGDFGDLENQEKAKKEFYYLFKSASIITQRGSNVDAFLELSDDELDVMLNSRFISGTLINVLKAYSKPGKQLDFLVGVDDPDVSWYDGDVEEVTFTLDGNKLVIEKNSKYTKYNIYGDGEKLGTTRSNIFMLDQDNIPTEIMVEGFVEGELRKMFIAISSLASNLTDEGGFSTDVITNLTDEDIDNILISDILVLSLIGKIEELANEVDAFVVIPEGDLRSADKDVKLAAWKNKVEDNIVKEGELAKIFKGLRIIIADEDLTDFSIDKITSLSENDINELLKSEVLSESIIVQIEKEAQKPDAIIVIPEDENLGPNDSRYEWLNHYGYVGGELVVTKQGELFRILKALKLMLDGGSIEDIDVNKLLNKENRETILTSKVLEASIINQILDVAESEDSVIAVPLRIKNSPNYRAWKKLPGEGEGELRKLLNALSYLMDENESIEDFNFDLSKVLDNKDEILKSEVFIETIVRKIEEFEEINIPVGEMYGLVDPYDRSAWQNKYLLDENKDYVYIDNKVVVLEYGEIDHLLKAIDLIIEPDPITGEKSFDDITFKVSVAFDEDKQKILLQSFVISETIIQKIFDEAEKGTVHIPSSFYLDQREDDSRERWFNKYSGNTLVKKNELAHLLDAVNILTGGSDFENMEFDLSQIFDSVSQEKVLRSLVISETIVHKIYEESENGVIKIPSTEYLDPIDSLSRDRWFNEYFESTVARGEIARLLDAINILTDGGDFSGVDFDISKASGENQDIVLRSLVISETIVNKIFEEAENGTIRVPSEEYLDPKDSVYRGTWYNIYSGGTIIKGEIARLLDAINILTDGGDFSGIDFDISKASGENQDIVLRSLVISETIVQKIFDEADTGAIIIPTEVYLETRDSNSRDRWYNSYSGSSVVKGEIARLLDAVNILTDGGDFSGIDFDVSKASGENQDIVLRSLVISETIVQKIFDEAVKGTIQIPTEEYLDPRESVYRDRWYNTYTGSTVTKGEIAYLLDAVNVLTGGGNFEDIDFDISRAYGENQNIVLRSYVISETIVHKIYEESENGVIFVPGEEYLNRLDDRYRDKWYNDYVNNTVHKGEIARLLDAVEILTDGGDFTGINFDLSKAYGENQETILKSYVISETIVRKVFEESDNGVIYVPGEFYLDQLTSPNRNRWYNTYNGGTLVKGEIAYLLDAVNIITDGRDFSGINFDISKATGENQNTILRSYVISETIVRKIVEEASNGVIYIPSEDYVNAIASEYRDKWYNTYVGGTVRRGEIAHLLDAVEILTDGGSFEGIDFDISKAFGTNQEIILRSKVVSETMVHKIYEESENGNISIPSTKYVNGLTDSDLENRNKWFNEYDQDVLVSKGELAHLLDAAEQILPENANFSNIDFEIEVLFNDEKRNIILKSYVFSETIINKIIENTDVITSVPSEDLQGRSLVDTFDRSAWYNEYDGEYVYENELGKFLRSIALVVGDKTFSTMDAITIDYLLELSFNYILSSEKEITYSDFEILLDSILIENIVAPIALEIVDYELSDYLVEPVGGYNFYKKVLITDHDLDTFDLSLYDLKSFLESLYLLKVGGFDYKAIGEIEPAILSNEQNNKLADAMVVSRIFKGSIAKMFNELLEPYYDELPPIIPFPTRTLKPWEEVMFIQSDYNGTPLESHMNLVAKLNSLANLDTYYE